MMKKSEPKPKFTPGPWKVIFSEFSIGNIKQRKFTVYGDGHPVAGCNSCNPDCYEENDRNGYLIAEAPEMLNILTGICIEKSAHICWYAPESCEVCRIRKIVQKVQGANSTPSIPSSPTSN